MPPELSDGSMTWENILKRKKENRNADYARELDKFREELNLKYFGYKGWYEFCVAEWGTKWDICEARIISEDDKSMFLSFETAWSPPIGAYEKLSALGFFIKGYYFEGGMMFCGSWIDGEDNYYEIEDCNAEWVKANIPQDIDEYMGISEEMEFYEENE